MLEEEATASFETLLGERDRFRRDIGILGHSLLVLMLTPGSRNPECFRDTVTAASL